MKRAVQTAFIAAAALATTLAPGEAKAETDKNTVTPISLAKSNSQLLVAGSGSHNIVRFDLTTGESSVIAKLANGSRPRSLAVNNAGEIFVGLRGNELNIVKLVPYRSGQTDGPLVAQKVTDRIGRFGPGLMAFDERGLLTVAGDTHRGVMRFDTKTGQLIEMMKLRAANLVGMTLAGNHVYAAEYFQKTVLRFDLASDPARGRKFIYKSPHLDRPHGMTIGHNGNLFVSSLLNSRIVEFGHEEGEHVRTFLDMKALGGGHVNDLHYEPTLDHYFITSGNTVFEVASDGALLSRLESEALSKAEAIVVLPATGATPVRKPTPPASIRLRVYQGDPSNRKESRMVLDRNVAPGKPFGFKGEFTLAVTGLVTEEKSGLLRFKGRVSHNGGAMMFDTAAKPGQGIRASGGLLSGVVIPFFVQLDRVADSRTADSPPRDTFIEVARLKELGAKVRIEDGRVREVDLTNSKITDADLEILSALPDLKVLSLAGCLNVTDAGLSHLQRLTNLQTLNLGPSKIGDAGLRHLSNLKQLQILNLSGTRVGDNGLAQLRGLNKISVLYLAHTRVTSTGMKTVGMLPELQWLDLKDTDVSDDGLIHLRNLKKLRLLGLVGCEVSDEGVRQLRGIKTLEEVTRSKPVSSAFVE